MGWGIALSYYSCGDNQQLKASGGSTRVNTRVQPADACLVPTVSRSTRVNTRVISRLKLALCAPSLRLDHYVISRLSRSFNPLSLRRGTRS
jgi:hypothetical protein